MTAQTNHKRNGMDEDLLQLRDRRHNLSPEDIEQVLEAFQETRELVRLLFLKQKKCLPAQARGLHTLDLHQDTRLINQGLPLVFGI